jgi:hypothetical protein
VSSTDGSADGGSRCRVKVVRVVRCDGVGGHRSFGGASATGGG